MLQNIIENLLELGFNRLEAEVYIQLLSHPPATAYKVGKLINKPTANVYKAIDALAKKGAVIIEDNKAKLCKAIKPDEFFSLYKANLLQKAKKAEQSLQHLQTDFNDQSSYAIKSVPLVFEKAKNILLNANSIVVVDVFPKALEKISYILSEIGKNGIKVYIEAYDHIEIPFTEITISKTIGDTATNHWDAQQLNIMVDGEVHLIALMDNDLKIIKQATFSQNIYMSCMLLAGNLKEQAIIKLLNIQNDADFEAKAKNILNQAKFFYNTEIPGFKKLKNL